MEIISILLVGTLGCCLLFVFVPIVKGRRLCQRDILHQITGERWFLQNGRRDGTFTAGRMVFLHSVVYCVGSIKERGLSRFAELSSRVVL